MPTPPLPTLLMASEDEPRRLVDTVRFFFSFCLQRRSGPVASFMLWRRTNSEGSTCRMLLSELLEQARSRLEPTSTQRWSPPDGSWRALSEPFLDCLVLSAGGVLRRHPQERVRRWANSASISIPALFRG